MSTISIPSALGRVLPVSDARLKDPLRGHDVESRVAVIAQWI